MGNKASKDIFFYTYIIMGREYIIYNAIIITFITISLYFTNVAHVLNEPLGLGIAAVGILLSLIINEEFINRFVLELPYTNVNAKRIYIVSGDSPQALITDSLKPKILVTDNTLELFSKEELNAVIEHEVGHIKFKHNIISVFLYIILALSFGIFLISPMIFFNSNINKVVSALLYLELVPLITIVIIYRPIVKNIGEKEADWYAVKNVGKDAYIRVLNNMRKAKEKYKLPRVGIEATKPSPLSRVLTFRHRHPKLYASDKYFFKKFITLDERINIVENNSYEPFSYNETIKLIFPVIFSLSVLASVTFTYDLALIFPKSSIIFPIILNLVVLFSSMILLIVLSAVIYFILRSLGIKEYLARTSIMAYYVITSLFFLFPGIIEGIIINLVGVTVAVLISSSEGKLGRAIIGWGSLYLMNFLGVLTWLTLLKGV